VHVSVLRQWVCRFCNTEKRHSRIAPYADIIPSKTYTTASLGPSVGIVLAAIVPLAERNESGYNYLMKTTASEKAIKGLRVAIKMMDRAYSVARPENRQRIIDEITTMRLAIEKMS